MTFRDCHIFFDFFCVFQPLIFWMSPGIAYEYLLFFKQKNVEIGPLNFSACFPCRLESLTTTPQNSLTWRRSDKIYENVVWNLLRYATWIRMQANNIMAVSIKKNSENENWTIQGIAIHRVICLASWSQNSFQQEFNFVFIFILFNIQVFGCRRFKVCRKLIESGILVIVECKTGTK